MILLRYLMILMCLQIQVHEAGQWQKQEGSWLYSEDRMVVGLNPEGDVTRLELISPRYKKEVTPGDVSYRDPAVSGLQLGKLLGIRFGFMDKDQDRFELKSSTLMPEGNGVVFELEDTQSESMTKGLIIKKTWKNTGDYRFSLSLELSNPTSQTMPLHPSSNPARNLGVILGMIVPEDYWAYHEVGKIADMHTIEAKAVPTAVPVHGFDYLSWRNQHFVLAAKHSGETVFASKIPVKRSEVTAIPQDLISHLFPVGQEQLAAGSSVTKNFLFFFGEKREEVMVETEFSSLFDRYGKYLGGIQNLMFVTLDFFYGLTKDWGWAIILLTFLVKLILLPLNIKQTVSMSKMQQVQPELKKIQEKYADDRQRLSQEMMNLYRTHKINPLAGCLPMLAQMPIFLALFYTVGGSVEILGSPFFWIPDLAAADPYLILPMVFTLSFVVTQSKMTMDPSQKALIYIMPVMLFVMMMHLPSGVMLYIVGQSLFTNVEQAMIKARIQTPNGSVAQVKTDMEIEKPVKNKKKKSKE